jgi:hypothetical protein
MRSLLRIALVVLVLAAAAGLASPTGDATVFRAQMLTGKSPVEPPLIKIQMEVKDWTTPEEVRAFQQAFNEGGTEAFLRAYGKSEKGVVRFLYAHGFNLPIHAALTIPTEKGKKVLLFLNRQQWDPGYQKSMGRYLFMAIELKLNEKGKGEGRFYEDANIRLDAREGTIAVETYEGTPKLFPQVQEVVRKGEPSK